MMSNNTRLKLKDRLEKLFSASAYSDMMSHKSKLSKAQQKKYKGGYSLSDNTMQIRELFLIMCKASEDITKDEEERVKGYLLKNTLLDIRRDIV